MTDFQITLGSGPISLWPELAVQTVSATELFAEPLKESKPSVRRSPVQAARLPRPGARSGTGSSPM